MEKDQLMHFLSTTFGADFIKTPKVISVSCLQFGDTGKGKFVDIFANWADMIVRPTGGDNAGHTIIHKGKEVVFHLIPSGIMHANKTNVIGSGTVVYPMALVKEIQALQSQGINCENLFISLKAKLILPSHIILDRLKESKAGEGRIGTTGKGIGPCYNDHVNRIGLTMNDLLNPKTFQKKLQKVLDYHCMLIKESGGLKAAEEILKSKDLEDGKFIGRDNLFSVSAITEQYLKYGRFLNGIIVDTDSLVRKNLGKCNILLEGAQGYLLSVDYGTYPYVTSSDCSVSGMAKGAGLQDGDVDASFGIVKGFYMTRVGKGPMPTEMGRTDSEIWCNEVGNKKKEEVMFLDASINDSNEFFQGIALRRIANEYGATTGRPRRTGWIDLPLLRYALNSGISNIIFSKLDVLSGFKTIKVCSAYRYVGEDYVYGDMMLTKDSMIDTAIVIPEVLENCEPIYQEFPGWDEDISAIKEISALPKNLLNILDYVTENVGFQTSASILSVGPGPDETIFN